MKGALISSAGANHVILSKQILIVLVVIALCAAFLFYHTEEAKVAQSLRNKEHVSEQNERLKAANKELYDARAAAKDGIVSLEDAVTDFDVSHNVSTITKDIVVTLRQQITDVHAAFAKHEASLDAKTAILDAKEDILIALQNQLSDKTILVRSMEARVIALNGTLPPKSSYDHSVLPEDDDMFW
eukprot:m.120913 g.120913  ORF g.120913 m.120913 type:complete len:185 (-) comp9285_c2_seq2:222-776(-)